MENKYSTTCHIGHFMNRKKEVCEQCSSNCLLCENEENCLLCEPNYIKTEGKCSISLGCLAGQIQF